MRRSYVGKNFETTLKFLRGWIEGIYLLKSKPEFSLGVLKKYVATQDAEVLNAIYGHYKEKLTTKRLHKFAWQNRCSIYCRGPARNFPTPTRRDSLRRDSSTSSKVPGFSKR